MSIVDYIGKPYIGDALAFARLLPDESVNCVITSPPFYGLRAYLRDDDPDKAQEIGLEDTPQQYVARLVELFREVRRVLRKDGVAWVNLGDCYTTGQGLPSQEATEIDKKHATVGALVNGSQRRIGDVGLPGKNLLMIPARVAIALQDDGWYLRSEIVWAKSNPMPESVTDRPTKAHEMVYLLAKSPRYWYDAAAIAEPAKYWGERDRTDGKYHNEGSGLRPHTGLKGDRRAGKGRIAYNGKYDGSTPEQQAFVTINETRNKRSVWTVPTQPTSEAHFATFPPDLIRPMILAGCPEGGICYDPFLGSGTTAFVAETLGRRWIGSELNPDYLPIILKRLEKHGGALEWLPLFSTNGGE